MNLLLRTHPLVNDLKADYDFESPQDRNEP